MTLRDVKPNPRNPRLIKKDRIEKLQAYMQEFGDLSGLVVNADGTTISGHQRTRVFKKEKGKLTILERYDPPAPDGTTARGFVELKDGSRFVYREVDWPQEKADRATIIANGQFGEWDADVLTNEWDMDIPELRDMGVPEFVFGGADVNGGVPVEAKDDDYEIPDEIKTDIVLGDLFEIGPHRLLCGDSTAEADVARLMDGAKADMVFTDPPYNINYGNIKHPKFKQREIENDNMSMLDFRRFCELFVGNIKGFNKGCVYVCGPPGPDGRIMFTALDNQLHCSTVVVWNKDQFTLGRGKYQNKYEPIWFGWNTSGSGFYGDRTQTNVWDIPRPKRSDEHPTMKPVEVPARAIDHASRPDDLVFDLFLGSGTTMVAAHQLNRKCYGMEIDPKYCQVIIDRMLKLDPEIEIKRNGKKYTPKTGD